MEILRDFRQNYKDYLVHFFIDVLLLIVRFIDRLYGRKKAGTLIKTKEEFQKELNPKNIEEHEKENRETTLESGRKVEENTRKEEDGEGNLTEHISTTQDAARQRLLSENFQQRQNVTRSTRNNEVLHKSSASHSESLEEVDSTVLESSIDLERQLSALSDYYSDEEEIASEWEVAKRDEAITDSLAIAEKLDRGWSEFRLEDPDAEQTYGKLCQGLDRLRDISKNILENWKRRNSESTSRLSRFISTEECLKRRSVDGSRDIDDLKEERPSMMGFRSKNNSINSSISSHREAVQFGDHTSNVENYHQTLLTYRNLDRRRSDLTDRMLREFSTTRKLQMYLEKKKIELRSKLNDQNLRRLNDSCEDLFVEQEELRDRCKSLKRVLNDREIDVGKVDRNLETVTVQLKGYLQDQSTKLKNWEMKLAPKFGQMQMLLDNLASKFEKEKSQIQDVTCNDLIKKMDEYSERLLTNTFEVFLYQWTEVSRCAEQLASRQKSLETESHQERLKEWKDFQELYQFEDDCAVHVQCYKQYVPEICQLHEWRHPGAIFGSRPEDDRQFQRFYRQYERKMKELEGEKMMLENARTQCCQKLKIYTDRYEMLLEMKHRQMEFHGQLKERKLRFNEMKVKLDAFRDSIRGHLKNKKTNELLTDRKVIVENFKVLENEHNECSQDVDQFRKKLAAISYVVSGVHSGRSLTHHCKRLQDCACEWDARNQFQQIFELIQKIEDFDVNENPTKLDFTDHEERVISLENSLPKTAELHRINCLNYLQDWKDRAVEYDEKSKEPVPFEEIKRDFEGWMSYHDGQPLVQLEGTFRMICERLRQNNGDLSKVMNLTELPCPESAQNLAHYCEKFQDDFPKTKSSYQKFVAALADFGKMFEKYEELKKEQRCWKEALSFEHDRAEKISEKLEICQGLLRQHRIHLEQRRIREKLVVVAEEMGEQLRLPIEDFEKLAEKLAAEAQELTRDFLKPCPTYRLRISKLHIPKKELGNFHSSITHREQRLRTLEDLLGENQKQLIKAEESVHEYFSLVQNLKHSLADDCKRVESFDTQLENVSQTLPKFEDFLAGFNENVERFQTHFKHSTTIMSTIEGAFDSIQKDVGDLKELKLSYELEYSTAENGDIFMAECVEELVKIEETLKDCGKRLLELKSIIQTAESQTFGDITEGSRHLEEMKTLLSSHYQDLTDQSGVLDECRQLVSSSDLTEKDREEKSNYFKMQLQTENYAEHCRTTEDNLIETKQTFHCSLCSKDIPVGEGVILRDCLHEFCKKCLEVHIQMLNTAEATCPGVAPDWSPCCGVILDKEIRSIGSEIYENYLSRSLSQYRNQQRDLYACGSCPMVVACGGQEKSPCGSFFLCPNCKTKNCTKCNAVHNDQTCEEFQASLPYKKLVDSVLCIVCRDRPINVALDPCGHASFCELCVAKLKRDRPPGPLQCPLCNRPITKTLKLFVPFTDLLSDKRKPTT